jgi:hypothetical protein
MNRRPRVIVLCAAAGLLLAACPGGTPHGPPPVAENGKQPEVSYREAALETTEIVEAPETGIDLGWGWDAFDSRPVRTVCVEFVERSEPAQARRMSMREVSDTYEVMQSMDMSAEASVKSIGFEVSGKAAFAKELNISSFASSFVLNASVDNGVRYTAPKPEDGSSGGGDVRLTAAAARLARGDIDEFQHQCGNAFVSAVYGGAKLTAVLTIQETNRAEQERLSAELSGEGWGARIEASLEEKEATESGSKRLDLTIFQIGGRGDAIPVSKEDLLDKMADLSSLAFDAPKDFRIAVTPYQYLSNWPKKPIVGETREYEELASYWGAYNTLYEEIQQVLDATDAFETVGLRTDITTQEGASCRSLVPLNEVTIDQLESAQDELLGRLVELKEMAQVCTQRPDECEMDTSEFRSPYAYRALLPIPKDDLNDADEAWRYHIADTAKSRCSIDVQNPGCLSNAQIENWAEKVGMYVVELDPAALASLLESVDRGPEICDGASRPAFSLEQGHDTLWFDPSRAKQVENWLLGHAAGE